MTTITINEKQAHEFAINIVSDIAEYIKSHDAEYRAYLLELAEKEKAADNDN